MAKHPSNMSRFCALTGLTLLLFALASSLPSLSSALIAGEPVPMHIYRDTATGNLVEVAEQLTGASAQSDLDALYLQEAAPLRTTSRRSSADSAVIRKPKGGVRYAIGGVTSGGGGAAALKGATNHAPLYVFRDPATGELVETEERAHDESDDGFIGTEDAATSYDRDVLYMQEADPVRVVRKAYTSSRQPRNGAKLTFNGAVTRQDGSSDVSPKNPIPASLADLDALYLEEMAPLSTGRSTPTVPRAATRKPRGGVRLSIGSGGAISSDSSAVGDQPLRVHRDPVSGKMVEVPVSLSSTLPDPEAAADLAKELDALYLQESAPFRVRRSGRKNPKVSDVPEAPLHVYRDASGAVVAELEVISSSSARVSAAEAVKAAELEALYAQDSLPIRIRRRAVPLGSDATPSVQSPPLHVYRDLLSGDLIEVPEQQHQSQHGESADAAAVLAAKLDSAYHDSAPVRVRRRTPNLGGRKSLDATRGPTSGPPAAAAATSGPPAAAAATRPDDDSLASAGKNASSDNSTVAGTVAALSKAAGSSAAETPSDVIPVRAFRDAETGELVEEPELLEEGTDDRQHQQLESGALPLPGSAASSSSAPSPPAVPSDGAADASLISELDSLYLHKSEPVRTYPSSRKSTDGSSSNAAPVTTADAAVVLAETSGSGAATAAAATAAATTTSGAGNRGPLRTPSGKTPDMRKSTLASILSSWTSSYSSSSTSSSSTSRSEQRRRHSDRR